MEFDRKTWEKEYYARPEVKDRQRAYASKPEVKERKRAYASKPEVKERQRAYNARYFAKPEVKERQRAYNARYFAKPEVKERRRAYGARYFAKPEVKERRRALRRDAAALARRLELAPDGVEAILNDARNGRRYLDIALDWLIEESDVGALARAHGIERRPRAGGGA